MIKKKHTRREEKKNTKKGKGEKRGWGKELGIFVCVEKKKDFV